jgi:hypothetical protein
MRGASDWNGSIRDSAGVSLVENPAEESWTDASRWRLEETLRIGSLDSDSTYQFGDIGGIGIGPAGSIIVLDNQADRPLRVFDAEGMYVVGSGGRGSGPGEFQGSAGPVFVAGDSLVVIPDGGNGRVNLFDTDGRFLRSISVSLSEMTNRWGATSKGIPVLQLGLSMMPGMEETDDLVDVLLAIGSDGTYRDTLLVFPSGRQMYFQGGSPELTFFAPEPFWVIGHDDVVWMGINDRYVIGSYENGALTRLISRAHVPVSVSERDREIVLAAWIGIFSQRIPNAEAMLSQLAQFYDVFPAYQQFMVNSDGTLWVQQILIPSTLTEQEAAEVDPTMGWGSRNWDVFDRVGRYLGAIELPHRFTLISLRGDHAYGVWKDELDVQYVMRLRIVR